MGWRRYGTIIEPLARRLTFGLATDLVARAMARFERSLNHYLTARHARIQQRVKQERSVASSSEPNALASYR